MSSRGCCSCTLRWLFLALQYRLIWWNLTICRLCILFSNCSLTKLWLQWQWKWLVTILSQCAAGRGLNVLHKHQFLVISYLHLITILMFLIFHSFLYCFVPVFVYIHLITLIYLCSSWYGNFAFVNGEVLIWLSSIFLLSYQAELRAERTGRIV